MKFLFVILLIVSVLLAPEKSFAWDSYWMQSFFEKSQNQASQLVNSSITTYKQERKGGPSYRFLTGLTQVDYRTNWDNGTAILATFLEENNMVKTQRLSGEMFQKLDGILKDQQSMIISNVQKVLYGYSHTQIAFPSDCDFEPLLFYLSKLAVTLDIFTPEQRIPLQRLVLTCKEEGVRGLGGNNEIIINPTFLLNGEKFLRLFIHEMGHLIDYYVLFKKPSGKLSVYADNIWSTDENDPSNDYYKISWYSASIKLPNFQKGDFVSGYSHTNPYEDFAEACTSYVQQGLAFKASSTQNSILEKKYNFIKTAVFAGKEFPTGQNIPLLPDIWDATEY